jgi:hypothetical protein
MWLHLSGAMAIMSSGHLYLLVPFLALDAVASWLFLSHSSNGRRPYFISFSDPRGVAPQTLRSKDPPKPMEVPWMIVPHWDLLAVCFLLLLLILDREVSAMRMHDVPSAITTWLLRAWFSGGNVSRFAGIATVDEFNVPIQGRHTCDA